MTVESTVQIPRPAADGAPTPPQANPLTLLPQVPSEASLPVASAAKAEVARRALQAAEAKMGLSAPWLRTFDVPQRDVPPPTPSPSASTSPVLRLTPHPPHPSHPPHSPSPHRAEWTCRDLASYAASRTEPGFTVSVEGSSSVVFAVAAALWDSERWGAVAALPDAGLLAARQAGIPLDRAVVVPDLGREPLRVLAALIDAFGVILTGPLTVTAADRRRIEARVRHRRAHLVVGGAWPGARVAVEVERVVRGGIGQGEGTLRAAQIVATVRSRIHELWGQAAG